VVDVGAVVNAHDVDDVRGVVYAVDDSVGAATGRMVSAELSDQRFAQPLRIGQKWAGEEFCDRRRDR
jgi:hypothetical protein